MIENKKFIQDVYLVQRFSNVFNFYIKILIGLIGFLFILRGVIWRSGGVLVGNIDPYIKILSIIITITAMVFIPYIFFILIKEKRRNWIITLGFVVFLPFLFFLAIFSVDMFFNQSALLPTFLYTIYCYILNSEVKEWLSEYCGHQNRLEQKKQKEEEAERIKSGLF